MILDVFSNLNGSMILGSRCCELPNVLLDVLKYLHFALKSIGIDDVWHLLKTQSCFLMAVCK